MGYGTVRDAIDTLPERWPDVVVKLRGQPMRLVERLPRLGVPVIMIGALPSAVSCRTASGS